MARAVSRLSCNGRWRCTCWCSVYYFWAWVGFGAQELWGSYLVYGFMWLLVAGLMVHWSHRGRVHLVPRVFAWALASSVTVLVVLPLLWRPTRTLLVPLGGVR